MSYHPDLREGGGREGQGLEVVYQLDNEVEK